MRINDKPFPIGVDNNPLVDSLYCFTTQAGAAVPGAGSFIDTEDGLDLETEGGDLLITET